MNYCQKGFVKVRPSLFFAKQLKLSFCTLDDEILLNRVEIAVGKGESAD